jgi:hypothetical protein
VGQAVEVVLSLANSYSAGVLSKARRVLWDMAEYAGKSGKEEVEVAAGLPSTAFLAAYLRYADERARTKQNAKKGLVPQEGDARLRTQASLRCNDGSSAAPQKLASLKFLQNIVGFNLDVESVVVKGAVKGAPRKAEEDAPPLTIGILLAFHKLVNSPGGNVVVKYQASEWLTIVYSGSRLEQAQMTDAEGEDEMGAVGVTVAKSSRTAPRPCLVIIPRLGIDGTDTHYETFKESLPPTATFMLRDVEGGDGNPFDKGVTGMANKGATWSRAAASLRGLLQHIGLTKEQASMFTPHSARHVLPHIAMIRGEPPGERAELGAWYGSRMQDRDMIPVERLPAQRRAIAAMPDRYAQKPKLLHVRKIFARQISAVRDAVQKVGRQNVPLLEGWDILRE